MHIGVPFVKTGVFGTSQKQYVIFDTPGSNSSSNIEHSEVLAEALEGFSNGIPVWISTYENLDSNDNADLCNKVLDIQALDKRFTMIVLNKADASNLGSEEFSDKRVQTILEYSSVEKMYSSGIYFVSSIMGIGSKNDGDLVDNFYRRIYRNQKEMYSDIEDEDYSTLYKYNIMPEQIKRRMIEYSEKSTDLIYANSGLYCIEKEIENFAGKYAAYNKCQMVYIFLNDVIDETGARIAGKIADLERKRKARSKELESAKGKLIDIVNSNSVNTFHNNEKASAEFAETIGRSDYECTYSLEAINDINDSVYQKKYEETNFDIVKNRYEESKQQLEKHKEARPGILKATPHNDRLTALHAICLHIFRHLAQKSLDIRQYACEISVQSDEKSGCASVRQSLCGIA